MVQATKEKGAERVFRKVMRYVEPKKFYEDNLFSARERRADTWRVCWVAEKVLLLVGWQLP